MLAFPTRRASELGDRRRQIGVAAFRIDADGDLVRARLEQPLHLEREGREAALMRADALAVEIDARAIIHRSEAEKLAFAGFGIGSEVTLIPDQPPTIAPRLFVLHPSTENHPSKLRSLISN